MLSVERLAVAIEANEFDDLETPALTALASHPEIAKWRWPEDDTIYFAPTSSLDRLSGLNRTSCVCSLGWWLSAACLRNSAGPAGTIPFGASSAASALHA